jgi:hypothetical protein
MEYSEYFRLSIEIDEEKREYLLVSDVVKNLSPDRKCWRLTGGALIE